MKRLLFAPVLIMTIIVTSCGNKSTKKVDNSVTVDTAIVVDTAAISQETKSVINAQTTTAQNALETNDSKGVTESLANFVATYKTFLNADRLNEAKLYAQSIRSFINDHKDTLEKLANNNPTISKLITAINNLPTSASATIDDAKNAVKDEVINLASPYIQKGAQEAANAETALNALKNAPVAEQEQLKQSAKQTIQDAKKAAENQINQEVDKAKEKANQKMDEASKKINETKEKINKDIEKAGNTKLKDLVK